MAWIFGDSFAHLLVADLLKKWDKVHSSWSIATDDPRVDGESYITTTITSADFEIRKDFGNRATLISGAAFRFTGLTDTCILIRFYDGTSEQVSVRISATGILSVSRSGTTLAAASQTIPEGVWHYIEFMATIHNTTGSYALRVNGAPIAGIPDASNVNTRNTTNNFANAIGFWRAAAAAGGSSGTKQLAAPYMIDNTGSQLNNFLGDCRYFVIRPEGAGAYTQFTPSAGANWETVDEERANTTDYVTSTADNQTDSYAFSDLTGSPTAIHVVVVNAFAQKTDAANKSLAIFTKASDGHETVGTDLALASTFSNYQRVLPQEPHAGGGRAWTVARVNGCEFGVRSRP